MLNFKNDYLTLPDNFYQRNFPKQFHSPMLVLWNDRLEKLFNLNLTKEQKTQVFSGKKIDEHIQPISLAYAGHQFGHFVPRLGDGRAHLLGQLPDQQNTMWDFQLKGSGPSLYSRRGDGLCALGPAIREFIMSEALYHLGINTTQSLAVVETGEKVFRQTSETGAIVTRVALSHLRIGSFEYYAGLGDISSLEKLFKYSIEKHYPEINTNLDITEKVKLFVTSVGERQIDLVCSWLRIGFIHGVMNTDNTTISGQTIDFGPCAFMDEFKHDQVFSSIDQYGRYNFSNQINIILWNISRLASTLIPLIKLPENEAIELLQMTLQKLQLLAQLNFQKTFCEKLTLNPNIDEHQKFSELFLKTLEEENLDYTNSFANLWLFINNKKLIFNNYKFDELIKGWLKLLPENYNGDLLLKYNPFYIPRNHLVQKAIDEAYLGNYEYIYQFIHDLKFPYIYNEKLNYLQNLPLENQRVLKTFCGT